MDDLEDFDFNEDGRTPVPSINGIEPSHVTSTTALSKLPARPIFARSNTADDGSSLFGGLSTAFDDASDWPQNTPASAFSPPTSPAVRATSLEEPLGPGIHDGSHLTDDGFVETTVDGKTFKVPADEVSGLQCNMA
jgi:hypothetical protein